MALIVVKVPDDFATIQAAVDNGVSVVAPGDKYVIAVAEGTYAPATVTDTGKADVTFVIRGDSKPIIDAAGADYGLLVRQPDTILQDLDIRNGAVAAVGQDTSGDRLTIRRCTLRDSPEGFRNLDAGGDTNGLTMRNVIIHSTPGRGIAVDGLSGQVLFDFMTVVVRSDDSALAFDTKGILIQGSGLTEVRLRNSIVLVRQTARKTETAVLRISLAPSVTWTQDRNVLRAECGAILGQYDASGGSSFVDADTLDAWKALTGQDPTSVDVDPIFEDRDVHAYALRQDSPVARTALPLGLDDPLVGTDDDWAAVIRAVDSPSIGALEVHDVVPNKGAGRLLAMVAGLSSPPSQVSLGANGLEDPDDRFRPTAFPVTHGGFLTPVHTGGSVTAAKVGDRAVYDSRLELDVRNAKALVDDRAVTKVSEIGLSDDDGKLIVARRFREIPLDPILPSYAIEHHVEIGAQLPVPAPGTWLIVSGNAAGPGYRESAGHAYDGDNEILLLFGGIGGGPDFDTPPGGQIFNDVWVLDLETFTWTQITTVDAPSARWGTAVIYDNVRRKYYLFGGATDLAATPTDEFYSLELSADLTTATFTQITPATLPPARVDHQMVRDPLRDRIVVIGGLHDPGGPSETWIYDYTDFFEFDQAPQPETRKGAMALWDHALQEIILFGGTTSGDVFHNDLWRFGQTWNQIEGDSDDRCAQKRAYGAFVFATSRRRYILFGGDTDAADGGHINDTQERFSGVWYVGNSPGAVGVPQRRRGTMAVYSESGGFTVLFGGRFEPSGTSQKKTLADLWTHRG